jgi:thiosulfate/3-mercaptopyruvate sulfurtransferase
VPGVALAHAVTADDIAHDLAADKRRLLDARAPSRYRGESETLDPVAGHIPGAVNRFFQLNLDTEFGAMMGRKAPTDIVHYCGSGVTACHNLLAMEVAGLSGSRLYPGSWSEWVADRARPVAVGD